MLDNFHMCDIILFLRAVLNMILMNASVRGPMCFRFMNFNLAGPWILIFYFVSLPLGPELW